MQNIPEIIDSIEIKDFYSDTFKRYGLWNNKAIYVSPLFLPYIDLFLVREMGFKPPSWRGRDFCVVLTHDVDFIFWRYQIIRRIMRRIKESENTTAPFIYFFAQIFNKLISRIKKNGGEKPAGKPNHTHAFDEWIEFEDKLGVKSTFFFFPLYSQDEVDLEDCLYTYDDKTYFSDRRIPVYELIREIKNRGWDIGIHGSILSARNGEIMEKQKNRTEKVLGFRIKSIRQHLLVFDPEITPYIQKDVGYEYDSTFGFNEICGFRAGTSYPFRWKKGKKEGVIEIPLVIQDGSLFSKRTGMGLERKTALSFCMKLAEAVREVGGILTIIWHSDKFYPDKTYTDMSADFLKDLLSELKKEGALITSLEETMKIWSEGNFERKINEAFREIKRKDLERFIGKVISERAKKIFSLF